MTLETQMFQNVHPGSQRLLQPLTILLLFAFADRQTACFQKAVVKLEPPWVQVLKEDSMTLKCEGAHNLGNYSYSTQWFHNGSRIPGQAQSSYRFKATMNDSGEYQCQMNQTSLSDPVHLGVISDWLLLQTSQLVFQEGETFTLKCHSWKSQALNKITFFQNGNPVRFSNKNSWLISKANHNHSGDYYCKAFLGKNRHTSKSVTITVQGPVIPPSSLLWYHVAFCLMICLVFAVDTGLYFYVRRNLPSSVEDWRNCKVRRCQSSQYK
ncbi:low affinity immunoglobulin gamma Fc region receptor II-a isoform X2 [Nannospalax galili]|uniref:low affinity immunoglobulin gamma Fc region receptor II-a isoform X2 n=1 Tax=Nannospalax galili TaxID=1026970 RepID=UPI0004ED20FC|nr:low affinity immunoglobulin gamma Fc region receptor II-a isoform X2 [Nannospalax galili]